MTGTGLPARHGVFAIWPHCSLWDMAAVFRAGESPVLAPDCNHYGPTFEPATAGIEHHRATPFNLCSELLTSGSDVWTAGSLPWPRRPSNPSAERGIFFATTESRHIVRPFPNNDPRYGPPSASELDMLTPANGDTQA